MVGVLIIVPLILVNAILGVQSQNLGHCLDTKINSTAAGQDACAAITVYIECLLQELNHFKANVPEHDAVLLQNVVNEHLAVAGIQCTVDIPAIVKKIRDYLKGNFTRKTKSPTGYDGARSIGDCANTLTRLTIQTGAMRCRLVIPYLTCAFRVTGVCKLQLTDQEYLSIESKTKSKLHHLGLRCEFHIRELCAEVARSTQRLH